MSSLLHDKVDLGAFSEIDHFGSILWTIGMAAGDVTKASIGNYIGEKRYTQAKNAAFFYQMVSMFIGMVFVPIILLSRNWIAEF